MATTEQFSPAPTPREQQAAPRPPSRLRKGVVAGAVALAIAAAGGGVVYAGGTSASSSEVGQAPDGMGGGPGGGAFGGLLHGEVQTGTVTAITDTSLTAESGDGYSRTYVIDAETVFGAPGQSQGGTSSAADIAEGDTVTVVAGTDTGDGDGDGTATAVQVSETAG